eukprot:Gb_08111 [translate_table: standard]
MAMPLVLALLLGFLPLALILIGKAINGSAIKPSRLLPPGSFGWPFLGESLQFLSLQRANRSHHFFDSRVKKYGREIFKTSLLGSPTVVFYSAAGNRFLFTNESKLVENSWPPSLVKLFGNSLLRKVGDDAKAHRKMLMTFLKPEALQKFVGRVDSLTKEHLRGYWMGKGEILAFPLIKHYTFSLACSLFASLEDESQQVNLRSHFIHFLRGLMQIPIDFPGTRYHRAKISGNHIRQILQGLVDLRKQDLAKGRASPEQDLLSYLLCNADENGNSFSDDDIKDNILHLLVASHDTSSVTMTFLLKYLAQNPLCYKQVLQEQLEIARSMEERQLLKWEDLQNMKYSWRVAQETLRIQAPAEGTFRKAIVEFSYGGFTIPKGWKLHWTVNSTHRNAEYFENPEKFDPSRFEEEGPPPYTFVPFGGGPRMCPGNEFARMEILVFLHNVVKNFQWKLMDPDEKVTVDPMPAPAKGLPIKLHPRDLHANTNT